MAKTPKTQMTPEQVAAKFKPNWTAVAKTKGTDRSSSGAPAEDVSPELRDLRRKFLGDESDQTVAPPANDKSEKTTLVTMTLKNPSDTTPGRKTVVVKGKRVIGEQG